MDTPRKKVSALRMKACCASPSSGPPVSGSCSCCDARCPAGVLERCRACPAAVPMHQHACECMVVMLEPLQKRAAMHAIQHQSTRHPTWMYLGQLP